MERVAIAIFLVVLLAGCSSMFPGQAAREPTSVSNVTITEVVDGDTVEVRFANGSADTVRLLGVDTPEVHVANEPEEFEGVPDTEVGEACLRREGEDASAYARSVLLGKEVRLVFDPMSDRRDRYGRLLAYVYYNDTNFNHELVEGGYARVYDSPFTESDRFYAAERRAQSSNAGVWRCAA